MFSETGEHPAVGPWEQRPGRGRSCLPSAQGVCLGIRGCSVGAHHHLPWEEVEDAMWCGLSSRPVSSQWSPVRLQWPGTRSCSFLTCSTGSPPALGVSASVGTWRRAGEHMRGKHQFAPLPPQPSRPRALPSIASGARPGRARGVMLVSPQRAVPAAAAFSAGAPAAPAVLGAAVGVLGAPSIASLGPCRGVK